MIDQVESLVTTFNLRSGKLAEAVRWANGSGFKLADRPDGTQRYYYQVLVAVRLAESRSSGSRDGLSQMSALLDYLFRQARAGHYIRDMIELLILQALVLDYQEDEVAASQALQQALELAQPGSLVRIFLDNDPALASLLAKMDGPYPRRLYQAFRQELRERGDKAATVPFDLTPREYEILLEIVAGLSNKEIEEKLVISRNTVRSHIKNLYSKLGVGSRTQAIMKAREVELL
jgi:LuxR family maltose regulon positive regulatory protein